MPRVSPEQLIRQFHENGLKLLLYDAANVRDLVTLRDPAQTLADVGIVAQPEGEKGTG